MGIVARQGIKTSIVSYLGVALGAVNTLFLYPKFLDTEEIGLLTLLTNVVLIIAPIAMLGVSGVLVKYYPFFKDDKEALQQFQFFVLLIPITGYALAVSILLLSNGLFITHFEANSPLFLTYLYTLVPFCLILLFRNTAEAYSRVLLRVAVPKVFKEVAWRILISALVIAYGYYSFSQELLVYGYIGAFLINAILLAYYVYKLKPFRISLGLSKLGRPFIKEALIYGAFIILSGFGATLSTKIDSWMIASLLDLSYTGIYSTALYIGLAIEMPRRAIVLISLPLIAQMMKAGKLSEVATLYSKSALNQFIIGGLLLTLVWVNLDDLFAIMPKGELFASGKYVVLFIGLGVLFDMATGVNSEIILMSKFYKLNLAILGTLIALTVLTNFLFIPIYGITGAAMATALSIFFYNVVKFAVVWAKLGIQPFSWEQFKAALLILGIFGLGLVLPDAGNALLNIGYKSAILIGLFVLILLKTALSPDINEMVRNVMAKLKR